jgi:hypothetical protein
MKLWRRDGALSTVVVEPATARLALLTRVQIDLLTTRMRVFPGRHRSHV